MDPVPFKGVHVHVAKHALNHSSFEIIAPGQRIETKFDAAEAHDLSSGGKFGFVADGFFAVADEQHNLVRSVPYVSNYLTAEIDGVASAAIHAAVHKRSRVQGDCQSQAARAIQADITHCARLAQRSQQEACQGTRRFVEYFKRSDPEARGIVSAVYGRIAQECSSMRSGAKFFCGDAMNQCSDAILAYTMPSMGLMAYCPGFYQTPYQSRGCHEQDQGNVVLHEVSHLRHIQGTEDYAGYGYDFIRSLPPQMNLNHADTYALFAQAVELGC